jgi:hypothetical protein
MPRNSDKPNPNDYVPKNYDDLYRYYILGDGNGNSLCRQIMRKILPYATPTETEELSQSVAMRLIEKQMLEKFDPQLGNFGGVIFFTTRTVCVNHLSKKSRNPITGLHGGSLASTDPDDGEFEPGVYSLDRLFGTECPDHETRMYTNIVVTELARRARKLFENPRHKRDESLFPLLKLLLSQHDPKECGAALGVTPSTIHNWLAVLKGMAKEIIARLDEKQVDAGKALRLARRTHAPPAGPMPVEDYEGDMPVVTLR